MTSRTRHGSKSTAAAASPVATKQLSLQQIMDKLSDNRTFMEEKFNQLNHTISQAIGRIEKIEREQMEMGRSLNYYGEEIEGIKQQLAEIRAEKHAEQEQRVKSEEQMRQQMTRLQHDKNRKTLIVSGIPITHNEDLKYLTVKLANTMEVEDMKEADKDTVYRSKKVADGHPPNIIIKFQTLSQRDKFYVARKVLSKKNITTQNLGLRDGAKIYVNEWLNPAEQHLFYLARKKKIELGYQFVWTYHCQIFMRKDRTAQLVKISDKENLESLS